MFLPSIYSALTMALLYCLTYMYSAQSLSFSPWMLYAFLTVALFFLIPYLLAALPLSIYLDKKYGKRSFHLPRLLYYAGCALLVQLILFFALELDGAYFRYTAWVFVLSTAAVYWIWESLVKGKRR